VANPLVDPGLEVGVPDVERALQEGSATVIDVREPYEWEAGRIAAARHVPLDRLASSAETIDRERPVIFVCRAGVRSLMAAQAFKRAGFEARSLAGGMEAWVSEGGALDPPNGHVAPH
jgi:rhodanese-related sulfurtransferase